MDTAAFDLPADLTGLSAEELEQLDTAAVEAFDGLHEQDAADLSDDDLVRMGELADAIDAIRSESAGRGEAAEARAARISELSGRVHGEPADPLADPAAEVAADQPADEIVDPVAEPVAAAVDPDAEIEPEPAAVAAAGAPSVRSVARTRPRVNRTPARRGRFTGPKASIVAAAGAPGFMAGHEMSLDDVVQAAIAAGGAFPKPGREGRQQTALARIEMPTVDGLVADGSATNVLDVLDRAADESRLDGGSLVASGGWCAPSETLYDLVALETSSGLLTVPEIGVTRGGVRFTTGPDFCDIYSNAGFIQTEAQDIAGTPEKPCYHVPCPDFVEKRLDAVGVCITAGILTQRAYPELIRRYVDGALIAHAHRVNAATLARIETGSTAETLVATGAGASAELLGAAELVITDYRYRHRMGETESVEVVLPLWARGVIRSDIAKRNGHNDPFTVSNADIDAAFAVRGALVQFVYDWQDAACAVESPADTSEGFGSVDTGILAYPATVKMLVYAAGTFVRGGGNIITLDAVYDSVLFKNNDYTALFTEEGLLLAKRGHDSRVVTVPICPDGATGAQVEATCPGF